LARVELNITERGLRIDLVIHEGDQLTPHDLEGLLRHIREISEISLY
jgi:hypothetical protein